jgi:hypothetical protein
MHYFDFHATSTDYKDLVSHLLASIVSFVSTEFKHEFV